MKHLTRRRFLGGAGAMVALPLLESLQPRLARGATAPTPRKLIVFYFPCGRNPETWVPTQTGANYTLSPSLASFSALQSDMLVLSSISNSTAGKCQGIGAHASATGPVFNGTPILNGEVFQAGITIDQLVANSLPVGPRFASLQWTSGQPTVCDLGASCTYTQCISWANATTPLAPISDPLSAYNQLFAGSDPGATAQQQAAQSGAMKSVLDYVLSEGNSFISTLSSSDKNKMDEYFTSIRSLENSLFAPASANCNPGTAPQAGPDYQTSVKAFCDMMVMALQCGLTQVITYMIEFDISYRSHPFLNVALGHHAITHTPGQDALNQLQLVETWQAQQLSYFATQLKAATDANGNSLLNSSVILGTAAMGLGGSHDDNNLAPLLIGNCGGYFKSGQHLDFGNNQTFNSLLVSIQNAMGVTSTKFGVDGTAPLPGIAA